MSEWQVVALGDVIELYDHRRVPLSAAVRKTRQGSFPYYGAQGVIDYIDDYIFDGRYILIPEDGENLNSRKLPIAYFAEGKFWVNNHAHIARARDGIAVDRFVQSALEASDISGFITGAAQPKLSQANLLRIPLRVPPFEDQLRIGEILDAIDDLIENNRRRIALLERMAQTIYREWFVHFRYPGYEDDELVDSPLGAIPAGWQAMTVAEAVEINPRVGGSRGDEVRFVTMGDLSNLAMDVRPSAKRVFGEGGSRFQRHDTLFARITPSVENGKTGFVQFLGPGEVAMGSTEFIVFRARHLSAYSTYCLARRDDLRKHAIGSMAGASGRQRVNNDCFQSFSIAVPPPSVEQRFAAGAEPLFTACHVLADQGLRLARLRSSLLPKLVTGAIDVSRFDLDALLEEPAA